MPKSRNKDELETGYTTGTCATATTKAALVKQLSDQSNKNIEVDLPDNGRATLEISEESADKTKSVYSTVKDAGDDPDCTDGARIWAEVQLTQQDGITFEAGDGVGTMTLPGMPVDPGEPAINPVPRQMIRTTAQTVCDEYDYANGVSVKIGVVDGTDLAKTTLNPRLGIEDGLSILGTTGIVKPYSHASYVASIEQGIDVAQANGMSEIVLSTGGRTEKSAKERHNLPDYAFVQFGGFLQDTLDYVRNESLRKISLYFMPGKFSKVVQGHLQLHSSDSQVDMREVRRDVQAICDPDEQTLDKISSVQSINQMLSHLNRSQMLDLMDVWINRAKATIDQFFESPETLERIQLSLINLDGELLNREQWSL